MRLTKKQTSFLLSLLLLFLFSGVSYLSGNKDAFSFLYPLSPTSTPDVLQSTSVATESGEFGTVTKVIDGDTIQVNGKTVRYIGIDTPETVDPRREVGCFGKEASDKNKELILGKEVRLEKDISNTDKYGRLLRYVYLPVGKQDINSVMINEQLVLEGFAQSSSYPPDVKYQDRFDAAEKAARQQKRGLWGKCP